MSIYSFLFVLVCLPIYCTATSFANTSVENIDGGIQINFTLTGALPGGTSYIILTECVSMYDVNDTSNSTILMTLSCAAINTTVLQACCNYCVNNGSNQGYLFLEGPVTAGDEYSCVLFGYLNGSQDFTETDNITPVTGIPSVPIFEVIVENDGSLNISVGSEYNGSSTEHLQYRIQVQNRSNVVHEGNYTAMNFVIDALGNGEFSVIAWTINEYGTSESEEMNITVNITSSPSSSTTTVSITTTVTITSTNEPNKNDPNVAAIIGGVAGGVAVLLAIAVAIVISIVVLLVVKKTKQGKIVKVIPVRNSII